MSKINNILKQDITKFILLTITIGLILALVITVGNLEAILEDKSLECNITTIELSVSQSENTELEGVVSELKDYAEELIYDNVELIELNKTLNNRMVFFIDKLGDSFLSYYDLSDSERQMIYRLVEAEVTGYGIEEKMNVAHVLINRIYSDQFPNTIEKVIYQNRQFSCIADGRYDQAMVTKSTVDAVNLALSNKDLTYGSLYFMNKSASDSDNVSWFESKLEFVMNDRSGHSFYK